MSESAFAELAGAADPPLDALALALAAEFRAVDRPAAVAALDALGEELASARVTREDPPAQARACAQLLAGVHGFTGEREQYDHPDNSMLDLVLERRRGLPILLSVLYVEVARRAGIRLAGVGLPGHFVVGHHGVDPPLLLDPFNDGGPLAAEFPAELMRPWSSTEIAMRMLNNLVLAYQRRGDLAGALRAAELRVLLPAPEELRETVARELRALQARLN